MRILLLGEYSRLHNSLKEGLVALGHEVTLVGSGDGFKNYPVDFSFRAQWCESRLGNIPRQIIHSLFRFDIALLESGIRFYFLLPKLKDFDVVQLINEFPIKTTKAREFSLLQKVMQQNKKTWLLSCGVDYLSVRFLLDRKIKKSILAPYFANPGLQKEYQYILDYVSPKHQKIHDLVYAHCSGIIASDFDYVLPLRENPKFSGLIPNPINVASLAYEALHIEDKIVLFLGINRWNYHQKGIAYFEKALSLLQEKYADQIEVIIAENLPYEEYIKRYNKAHILLDQTFAYDQGYNALEAMAKGKVVFTGAEKEFRDHYQLEEDEVVINAKPDVDYLVEKLSFLIENPEKIHSISRQARLFIEKEHHYITIAQRYLATWNKP